MVIVVEEMLLLHHLLVTPRTTTREILTASRRRSNSRFSVVTVVAGKFKMRTANNVNVVIPTTSKRPSQVAADNNIGCTAIDKACAHLNEWDVIGFDSETKPTTNKGKKTDHTYCSSRLQGDKCMSSIPVLLSTMRVPKEMASFVSSS